MIGRPRATEAYVQQKVSLPATLVARFSMLHTDPMTRKTKYGKISEVLTKLLTSYVNQMETGGTDPLAQREPEEEPPVENL